MICAGNRIHCFFTFLSTKARARRGQSLDLPRHSADFYLAAAFNDITNTSGEKSAFPPVKFSFEKKTTRLPSSLITGRVERISPVVSCRNAEPSELMRNISTVSSRLRPRSLEKD